MNDLTSHDDRLPYCDCHACALFERNRLRAELDACETELRTVRTSQAESNAEIERLRAELAELRDKLKVCFPLLDEVGLDEEIHCCEWILQQERKRLHAAMAGGE